MNDEELRSYFDVLVDRVPPGVDTEPQVRRRAAVLRRRRSGAAVVGTVLLVGAAVAVPQVLQHQGKSAQVTASGLTTTCQPAAVRAAGQFGTVERMYGTVTTVSELKAWRVRIGGAAPADARSAATPVPLCLLIGRLEGPAGSVGERYALVSMRGDGAEVVYTGPDLPTVEPMPGVKRSDIRLFSGPAGRGSSAASTTDASAVVLSSAPPVSLRACTSADLSATFGLSGSPDGVAVATVQVLDRSASACVVQGDLHGKLLDASGAELDEGPTLPAGALHVDGLLHPAAAGVTANPLSVRFGADQPPCPHGFLSTPATFVVTVGKVELHVRNLDPTAPQGHQSLSGCSGAIYADSAQIG
jgi:hypothetical protein